MDLHKTTAVNIEEVRRPSVTFHLDYQQNTRTKMAERRISSCPSCFAYIPLIPAFLLSTLVKILVIFMVDDVLNGFS